MADSREEEWDLTEGRGCLVGPLCLWNAAHKIYRADLCDKAIAERWRNGAAIRVWRGRLLSGELCWQQRVTMFGLLDPARVIGAVFGGESSIDRDSKRRPRISNNGGEG